MHATLDGVRLGQYEICLSTITTVHQNLEAFSDQKWSLLVIDEVHQLKSASTACSFVFCFCKTSLNENELVS
jgi:hypothetical protein